MKKLVTLFLGLGALCASAQTDNAKAVSFGLRGGVNFQNFNGKNWEGNAINNDLIVGYHVGANVAILLAPDFYLQPEVLRSK